MWQRAEPSVLIPCHYTLLFYREGYQPSLELMRFRLGFQATISWDCCSDFLEASYVAQPTVLKN